MPNIISQDVREQVALRLNAGSTPKMIGESLGCGVKSVYRMKKQFTFHEGNYIATPLRRTMRASITRAALVEMSQILTENPKLTLKELRDRCIEHEIFEADDAPDISSIWRRLQQLGHRYKKPIYQDDRAKRTIRQHETCIFRKSQDEQVLDPTTLLSFDETFIFQ